MNEEPFYDDGIGHEPPAPEIVEADDDADPPVQGVRANLALNAELEEEVVFGFGAGLLEQVTIRRELWASMGSPRRIYAKVAVVTDDWASE